jgi:hypothetical protein
MRPTLVLEESDELGDTVVTEADEIVYPLRVVPLSPDCSPLAAVEMLPDGLADAVNTAEPATIDWMVITSTLVELCPKY